MTPSDSAEDQFVAWLDSRSIIRRMEAVEGLERAGAGTVALRRALAREKHDVVLAMICEALMLADDKVSVRTLMRLARSHWSGLVRSYASWAVAVLRGPSSIPWLRK